MKFHTTGRIEKMRYPRKDIKHESRACGFSSILMISAVLIRPIERQQKMTVFCLGNYSTLKLRRLQQEETRNLDTENSMRLGLGLGLKSNSPFFLFFLHLALPSPTPLFSFLPFQLLFSLLLSLPSFLLLPSPLFYPVS